MRTRAGLAMLICGAAGLAVMICFPGLMQGWVRTVTAAVLAGLAVIGAELGLDPGEDRRRAEQEKLAPVLRRHAPFSWGWAALCSGVLILTESGKVPLTVLSLSRGGLEDGQLWRAVSYMAAHLGAVHFLGNMFILLTVGRRAEQLIGSLRFGALFLTGGIAGGLAELGFGAMKQTVGCSGALYSALFLLTLICIRREHRYVLSRWLVPVAAASVAETALIPGMSIQCHLGGAAWGALCFSGWVLWRKTKER